MIALPVTQDMHKVYDIILWWACLVTGQLHILRLRFHGFASWIFLSNDELRNEFDDLSGNCTSFSLPSQYGTFVHIHVQWKPKCKCKMQLSLSVVIARSYRCAYEIHSCITLSYNWLYMYICILGHYTSPEGGEPWQPNRASMSISSQGMNLKPVHLVKAYGPRRSDFAISIRTLYQSM